VSDKPKSDDQAGMRVTRYKPSTLPRDRDPESVEALVARLERMGSREIARFVREKAAKG
jgi:hypothetical protein